MDRRMVHGVCLLRDSVNSNGWQVRLTRPLVHDLATSHSATLSTAQVPWRAANDCLMPQIHHFAGENANYFLCLNVRSKNWSHVYDEQPADHKDSILE
jgi:hypothetical protein